MTGKLWLTYAWLDNEAYDVDHIILELRKVGLDVHFDRRQIVPGQRLWTQIDSGITDPSKVDGWAIVATKNSLRSEPCLEELAYALDRALRARGANFPLIGIFPEPIDRSIIPSAIATRLYVNLNQADWASLVRDAVAGRRSEPNLDVAPFVAAVHQQGSAQVIELRPRSGRWYPCSVLVPAAERSAMRLVAYGPAGAPPAACAISLSDVSGGDWAGVQLSHSVDNLNSAYVYFDKTPSALAFGQAGGQLTVIDPIPLLTRASN